MENGKSKREDVCPGKKLDRAAVERQLTETKGPEYWRSLEELAGSEEFRDIMHREFPKGSSEWLDSVSRRGFLQTMGASLALAGLLDMYDPDRSQTPVYLGETRSWKNFVDQIRTRMAGQRAVDGEGFRLLTGPISSPTLANQIQALLKMYPKAKWHQYSPLHRDNVLAGSMLAF